MKDQLEKIREKFEEWYVGYYGALDERYYVREFQAWQAASKELEGKRDDAEMKEIERLQYFLKDIAEHDGKKGYNSKIVAETALKRKNISKTNNLEA